MDARIQHTGLSGRDGDGQGGSAQHQQGRGEDDDGHHLHVVGFDLLAQVFRGAADHQARNEDRQHREGQHAVQPRAHAAIDHFAQLHLQHRRQPAHGAE
ncbi:hypothetical protein D3C73_822220 [compost metagenome]